MMTIPKENVVLEMIFKDIILGTSTFAEFSEKEKTTSGLRKRKQKV